MMPVKTEENRAFFVLVKQDGKLVPVPLGKEEPDNAQESEKADGFAVAKFFKDETAKAFRTRNELEDVIERVTQAVEKDQGDELLFVIVGQGTGKRLSDGEHKGRIIYQGMTRYSWVGTDVEQFVSEKKKAIEETRVRVVPQQAEPQSEAEDTPEFEAEEDVLSTDEILVETELADYPQAAGYPTFSAPDTVVQKVDTKRMSVDFNIVTRGKKPNRHGAMVQIAEADGAQGLMTDNFDRNPVVLFDHGMSGLTLPIATARDPQTGTVHITKNKRRATSRAFFSQVLPEAELIFAMTDEGIFNASSVQFLPIKARRIQLKEQDLEDGEISFDGMFPFDFIESDLMEWSVVSIPADPGALRKCLDRGHCNGARLTPTLKHSFDKLVEKPVWSPGFSVQVGETPETLTFANKQELYEYVDKQRAEEAVVEPKPEKTALRCNVLAEALKPEKPKNRLATLLQKSNVVEGALSPIVQKVDTIADKSKRLADDISHYRG